MKVREPLAQVWCRWHWGRCCQRCSSAGHVLCVLCRAALLEAPVRPHAVLVSAGLLCCVTAVCYCSALPCADQAVLQVSIFRSMGSLSEMGVRLKP